jgi:hypothetical protein
LSSVALTLVELAVLPAIVLALWKCWQRPCYQFTEFVAMALFVTVNVVLLAGLFGFAFERRLRGFAKRRIFSGTALFCVVLLIGLPVALVGLAIDKLSEASDRILAPEYQNLSYARYLKLVGVDPFIPKGALHVYATWGWTKDSKHWFRKMRIPADGYDILLTEMAKDAATLPFGPVRKLARARPDIPDNWPQPLSAPDWWQPEKAGPNVQVTLWESQASDGSDFARGWYLARDLDTNTVWLCYWQGYQDLGWDDSDDLQNE